MIVAYTPNRKATSVLDALRNLLTRPVSSATFCENCHKRQLFTTFGGVQELFTHAKNNQP